MENEIARDTENNLDWSEIYHFSFYDKKNDIAVFMRIMSASHRKEKAMSCYLSMPDGSTVGSRHRMGQEGQALTVRNLRFERTGQEGPWRINHSGAMMRSAGNRQRQSQVDMVLEFEGMNETINHWGGSEQFGRFKGNLAVGLDEFEIDALGARYDIREGRGGPKMKSWKWLGAQFSDELAISVTKTITDDEERDSGFIFESGENIPLTTAKIDTDYHIGRKPRSFRLALGTKDEKSFMITGRIVKVLDLPAMTAEDIERVDTFRGLAKYEMGDKVGYGIVEYLFR